MIVYGVCASSSALTTLAALLPKGPVLLGVLLVVAAGTLGLFPCYYSFSQDLGRQNVGKISGLFVSLGWLISAPTHKLFGKEIDASHSFDLGNPLIGLAPLCRLSAMVVFWRRR